MNTLNYMPRQKRSKKIILGVTGGFGSGKSTVSGILKAYGAELIDADKLAHSCIASQGKCYKRLIRVFGNKILKNDESIDRAKLGKIVFGNKKLLRRINNIIHPEVIKEIKKRIKRSKSGVIVLDVPLLIESGLKGLVDKLIVVKATRVTQIRRALKSGVLNKADVLKRINSQIPLRVKSRLADFVIDNSGSTTKTRKQAADIWRSLGRSVGLGINLQTR